jgi:spermidine synthase
MVLKILLPIFFIGLLALQAQVLLFRELLVSSQGNELAVGLMLLLWLSGTGLGSLAGGRLLRKPQRELQPSYFLLGMALLLPTGLLALRSLPVLLGFSMGEMPSLPLLFFQALLLLLPFCFFSGILFPLLSQKFSLFLPSPVQVIGRVYLFEALGAAVGGVLGVLLLTRVNGLPLAFLIGAGLSACSFWTSVSLTKDISSKRIAIPSAILGILCLTFSFTPGKHLDYSSRSFQWRPYALKISRETPFGSLVLNERAGQFNFFINGNHQFSYPDPRAAEEKTHLPLLFHEAPKKVFLIGGGPSGILREILKHPSIEGIDYVELDKVWVEAAGRFLPGLAALLKNPKINLMFGDGRPVLAKAKGRYDLILIDFPGPDSLLLNRFYTREFFQTVKNHLNPEGLFAFSLRGPTDMMGATQVQVFRIIYQTLSRVFSKSVILSGEEVHFFGIEDRAHASLPLSTILQRITERDLRLQYLNSLQIESMFSPWRKNYLQTLLAQGKIGQLNEDLIPTGFFYQSLYHLAHQYPFLANWFSLLERVPSPFFMLLLALGFIVLGAWHRLQPNDFAETPVLIAVMVAGFSSLALEILVLVLFQVFLGYLYLEIGSLIACFMAGLAGGVYVPMVRESHWHSWRGITVGLQALLAVCSLLLFIFLGWNSFQMDLLAPGLLRLILYSFMILTGLIAGAHYFLCSRALLHIGEGLEKTAGRLYGVDLLGAALGSLATGLIFLPLWGFETTLLLLFLLNLGAAWLLFGWKAWHI